MSPQSATSAVATNNQFPQIDLRRPITRKKRSLFSRIKNVSIVFTIFCSLFCSFSLCAQNQNTILDETAPYYINPQSLGRTPIGGDTIFVMSTRTFPLRFQNIEGDSLAPVVIINRGGQVKINDTISNTWGALTFENSKYIKVSGAGHPGYKYGFELAAVQSGLAFTELSSDCEAEFIKISHDGFFGIMAKKNFDGNPPTPYPVFKNLIIHDCFIENVSEGMYLGEVVTPGMEFKHVKIYNNIIRNTLRESIQIANMVEDVEIYNNTMINAGLEGLIYHMNNLQIGDNTVANIYNNILIDAPVWGIINMGKGDCIITNNYIASSQGIFCDNRTVSDSLAPIDIKQNYFRSILGNQMVRNMNEINYLTAQDNKYDTNISFYLDQTGVDNDTIFNNTLTTVTEIQFTDPTNDDYSLAAGTPTEYLNMGAPGGPLFFEYEEENVPVQLVITPEMVIDSVSGGSILSPLFLFDEQSTNIQANEHPVSDSWKPDYAMQQSSYHALLDLKQEYHISKISLHDMSATHNFTVEYYDGTAWANLFVDPCDNFNEWQSHYTDVSTRYLRFSMYDSPYAAVNEIIICGYLLPKTAQQVVVTSGMVTDQVVGGSVDAPQFLFDEQTLDISANQHAVSASWKPATTNTNAPFNVMIDLGQDYHLSEINFHDMNDTHDFIVEYGDGPDWVQLLTEPCDAYNTWKSHTTDVSTRYLRLKMPQSPLAAVNEIIISGYPIMTLAGSSIVPSDPLPEDQQIVITTSMITDLVTGGSVFSPQYLFDEQTIDPILNEQPTSNPWKPYFNNANAPYYATINLQEEYHISKIYMYDSSGTHNFNVDYDDNGSWLSLFVEPCDAFNVWKIHETDVETQHLRLAMLDSPYAAINEIVIYGYPTSSSSKKGKKSHSETTIVKEVKAPVFNDQIQLFPNPVNDKLYLKFPESMMGQSSIHITNSLGSVIYRQKINLVQKAQLFEFNAPRFLRSSGFYIFTFSNKNGAHQSIKFFKE